MGLKTQPISDPIRPGPEGSVCLIRCISITGQEEKEKEEEEEESEVHLDPIIILFLVICFQNLLSLSE